MTGIRQGDDQREAAFQIVALGDVKLPKRGIEGRSVGDSWGNWTLTRNLTLEFEGYEVLLEKINDVREALDWIAHLAAKTAWLTPTDIGDFVLALDACIPLREKLLFGGREPYHVRKECPWLRQ